MRNARSVVELRQTPLIGVNGEDRTLAFGRKGAGTEKHSRAHLDALTRLLRQHAIHNLHHAGVKSAAGAVPGVRGGAAAKLAVAPLRDPEMQWIRLK